MCGTPLDGLRAQRPGNPHRRIGFLVGQRPRIDMAIMKMFALVAPRSRLGPGFDNKVVRFVEHLPVIGRIGIIEELLAARAAHPAGDQAAARDEIDLGQLFGHPQRMFDDRQGVPDQNNLGFAGNPSQDRGFYVHDRPHADRVAVMLIQGQGVEPQVLGVAIFVEVVIVVIGRLFAVEMLVRNSEKRPILQNELFGQPAIRPFSEISDLHLGFPRWIVVSSSLRFRPAPPPPRARSRDDALCLRASLPARALDS